MVDKANVCMEISSTCGTGLGKDCLCFKLSISEPLFGFYTAEQVLFDMAQDHDDLLVASVSKTVNFGRSFQTILQSLSFCES